MRKLSLPALALVAGCAQTVDVKSAEEATFAKYRNQHVSKLSALWGPPEQVVSRPEGTIYSYVGQSNAMALSSFQTGVSPPATVFCRVRAYTDSSGNIVRLAHVGVPEACAKMYNEAHQ